MLTDPQRETLLRPLKEARVQKTRGNSYLEAYDVIAHLTRIFGFEGWDKEIIRLDLIFETMTGMAGSQGTPEKWTVAYRCAMRLTVRDPEGNVIKTTEDVGTGDAVNQPSRGDAHDLASKSAVSGALKRCAKDLGDQFGLGLYDGGSVAACVKRVVIYEGPSENPDSPPEVYEPPAYFTPPPADAETLPPITGENLMTSAQRGKIFALAKEHGLGDAKVVAAEILGVPVPHLTQLTRAQAHTVIDRMIPKEAP